MDAVLRATVIYLFLLVVFRAHKARVDVDDVLEEARSSQGLEGMEQVKYAVLERDGSISVIPK